MDNNDDYKDIVINFNNSIISYINTIILQYKLSPNLSIQIKSINQNNDYNYTVLYEITDNVYNSPEWSNYSLVLFIKNNNIILLLVEKMDIIFKNLYPDYTSSININIDNDKLNIYLTYEYFPILDLPFELVNIIGKYITSKERLNLESTSKLYREELQTQFDEMHRLSKIIFLKNIYKYRFTNILYDFEEFNPNIIPIMTKKLSFLHKFNNQIYNLPKKLTHLSFTPNYDPNNNTLIYSYFNKLLIDLPKSLTHLTLSSAYMQPFPTFTGKLTHLSLVFENNNYYNKYCNIIDLLPNSLIYLALDREFNFNIDNLPKNLKYLIFNKVKSLFNQSIDNLPESLTHLTLGNSFNQSIDNLPKTLTHLTLGYDFNKPIDKLPESLTHLTLGYDFNQPIDNLPNSLTHLTLGYDFNQPIDNLPESLTHLTLGYNFNQSINSLPESLTHLTLGPDFNQRIDYLPEKLLYLILGKNFDQPIDNLPETLIHLKFKVTYYTYNKFNQSIDHLPNSLTHLTLGYNFNKFINKLPYSLTHLTINYEFNKYINNIPNNITHLTLTSEIKENIYISSKITHLIILDFSIHYQYKIPKTIKYLKLIGITNTPSNVIYY